MAWHPCRHSGCPEYNQGQCFGGGCSINPMQEDNNDDFWPTESEMEEENE